LVWYNLAGVYVTGRLFVIVSATIPPVSRSCFPPRLSEAPPYFGGASHVVSVKRSCVSDPFPPCLREASLPVAVKILHASMGLPSLLPAPGASGLSVGFDTIHISFSSPLGGGLSVGSVRSWCWIDTIHISSSSAILVGSGCISITSITISIVSILILPSSLS
jgi:hypothetical protein